MQNQNIIVLKLLYASLSYVIKVFFFKFISFSFREIKNICAKITMFYFSKYFLILCNQNAFVSCYVLFCRIKSIISAHKDDRKRIFFRRSSIQNIYRRVIKFYGKFHSENFQIFVIVIYIPDIF